ncbi:plectin-like [Quillaja saponaria]|uniref:Plectin-like n=1 Tax=Quillaja saponaria TaxID=32244 RepID=A0AAD7PMN3_QUISA|nr:plectin-like [Quillaja saponaria]
MGDFTRNIDVEKLISYSDELVQVLKDKRDVNSITQLLEHSKTLGSSCNANLNENIQGSLCILVSLSGAISMLKFDDIFYPGYQKKIDECKQKEEEAKSEVAADAELDHLRKELEKERLVKDELRVINNEINDLERKRVSIQERKQSLKKLEEDKLKAQRMLSLYASVTTTIPDLDDQSKISGYNVDRDKRVVDKFEFNPTKMTALNACNGIWKMKDS